MADDNLSIYCALLPRQGTQRQEEEVREIRELRSQIFELTSLVQDFSIRLLQDMEACRVCSLYGHRFEACPQLLHGSVRDGCHPWELPNPISIQCMLHLPI